MTVSEKRIIPPGGGTLLPHATPVEAPPAYGVDPNRILIVTFPLDDARDIERYFTGACNFIWALEATSLTASISLRFQSQRQSSVVPFSQGQWIKGIRFDTLFLTNTAQAGASITFFMLREGPDSIDAFNPSAAAATVNLALPTVIDTVADVSLATAATTQILPALATRHNTQVSNLSGNPREIRIGDLNTGAARGRELNPGETILIEGTEAIHGFNPHVAAMSVGVTWIAT